MSDRIGFMQGRLSGLVDGRIQAFPWDEWENEFELAPGIDLHVMEWTLDQERLRENPLLTVQGRQRIAQLSARSDMTVASVTGDCFMQAPFWKASGEAREALLADFRAVVEASGLVGARYVVVPLVDAGALDSRGEEDLLVDILTGEAPGLRRAGVEILFECDFGPQEFARLMDRLPAGSFGVNYDIGNSAALGFAADEELSAYGSRVRNVHVKDRVRGGTTVPLGSGSADFELVFSELRRCRYAGRFIMQTARAADGDHVGALRRYRDMVLGWIQA